MNKVLLFIFFFTFLSSSAQKGLLKVSIYDFENPVLGIIAEDGDTVKVEHLVDFWEDADYDRLNYFYDETKLDPGVYHIYLKQGDSIYNQRKNINIRANKSHHYEFSYDEGLVFDMELDSYEDNDSTLEESRASPYGVYIAGGIELSSALPTDHDSYNYNFGAKLYYHCTWVANDWFGGGIDYGISYEYHNLNQYDVKGSADKLDHQYYTYWGYTIGGHFVFSMREYRPIFMLGVRYNLPLYTRLNQRLGNEKLKTKDIHNWNDLRFSASLGYNFIHVYAEYRPFTFMKEPIPDLPLLYFGLRFTLGDNLE